MFVTAIIPTIMVRFVVQRAEQEKKSIVIRAEGEAQSARLISSVRYLYVCGCVALRTCVRVCMCVCNTDTVAEVVSSQLNSMATNISTQACARAHTLSLSHIHNPVCTSAQLRPSKTTLVSFRCGESRRQRRSPKRWPSQPIRCT